MESSHSRPQRTLHVGQPNIGNREQFDAIVDSIFQKRWFTNDGEVVQELEAKLAQHLGVKHCIAVCNGTMGLQLACHAMNLTGEVIVPAFTFVATPHAVRWERLTPVFADINPETHCLCPDHVESLITDQTSAIIGVHLWGHPCAIERLESVARKHDLRLIFDAAHAFSCAHRGTMIGNFGDCEVFSFHATKFFNTFEGGAIATNCDQLAARLRLMKNFGFEAMDKVVHLGTNAKMPEICAAMGLSMFDCIDDLRKQNQRNYQTYKSLLAPQPGLRLFPLEHLERTNWQYVVVEIHEDHFGLSRDEILEELKQHNIRARRYFYPGCHRMEPYASENQSASLPNTEAVCDRVICLPTGGAVDRNDIVQICNIFTGLASLGNVG